jgi:thiol:disulfide interchange protein DsbC
MLKHRLIALSLLAAFSGAHAADAADAHGGPQLEQMRKQLSARMPGANIGAITKAPFGGLYEVVINGLNIFYTDENANVAILGKVIDLKTQKDLVEARTQELQHVDFARLPLDKAIVTVKGNGSRKLAVFSDPECPFCQELEHELDKVSDVTIYTFLYPLAEIHPDAERKAKLVWCSADRAKAWREIMLEAKEPAASDKPCEAPFQAIREVAQKFWITGTPGLVFGDGKLVPGVIKAFQIERNLAASQPKAAVVQSMN